MGDTAEDLACKIVFDICRCDSADHLIDFAQEAIEARDAAIRAEAKREELQRIAKMVREREAEQDRLADAEDSPGEAFAHCERAFAMGVLAQDLEQEIKEASDG